MVRSLWNLTGHLWRRSMRDPSALFASLLLPVILMMLLGSFRGPVGGWPVTIAVIDRDESAASRVLMERLEAEPGISVSRSGMRLPGTAAGDVAHVPASTQPPHGAITLTVPEGFGSALEAGGSGSATPVVLEWDAEANGDSRVLGAVALIEAMLSDLEWQVSGERPRATLATEDRASAGGYIAFLLPGLIGMTSMMTGLNQGAVQMVRLRERGVLKHLLATPIHPGVVGVAWSLVSFASLVVRLALLVLVAVLFFDVRLDAHLPSALTALLLAVSLFMAVGLLVATAVRRVRTASTVVNVLALPVYFLSETFFPLGGGTPSWLRAVVAAMPLTPLNQALRAVLTQGETLAEVGPQMVTLAAWLAVAVLALGWRLRDPTRVVG